MTLVIKTISRTIPLHSPALSSIAKGDAQKREIQSVLKYIRCRFFIIQVGFIVAADSGSYKLSFLKVRKPLRFFFPIDKTRNDMLYQLFEYIEKVAPGPGTGLFQYLSFRSAAAMIISLIISIIFGKRIIRSLKKLQVGESVRDLGLDGQKEKEGTPTMGGLIILLSILVPTLLFADLSNVYVHLVLLATVWLAFIGFADDYIKVFKKNKAGLKGKFKILGQVSLGIVLGLAMLYDEDIVVRMDLEYAQARDLEIVQVLPVEGSETSMAYVKTVMTNVPFFSSNQLDYANWFEFLGDNASQVVLTIFYILLIIVIVTAVSNAANLTDGIDGLAAGISAIVAFALCVFAYVSGNTIFAEYLDILYIPDSGELVVFGACLLGACVGFLWYNAYPARVFMGDTGSLMLGGVIATMAIVLRKELLIPLLCGIFLIENVSVMLQVGYFKYTKKKYGEGKRIFLMSPIHHHYQKLGMHESKIVTRFWIVQILLAAMTIVTLKIR